MHLGIHNLTSQAKNKRALSNFPNSNLRTPTLNVLNAQKIY